MKDGLEWSEVEWMSFASIQGVNGEQEEKPKQECSKYKLNGRSKSKNRKQRKMKAEKSVSS